MVVAVFVLGTQVIIFGKQLVLLKRRKTWFNYNVVFEIEYPLKILKRHVE